jgi:hypothetical protein
VLYRTYAGIIAATEIVPSSRSNLRPSRRLGKGVAVPNMLVTKNCWTPSASLAGEADGVQQMKACLLVLGTLRSAQPTVEQFCRLGKGIAVPNMLVTKNCWARCASPARGRPMGPNGCAVTHSHCPTYAWPSGAPACPIGDLCALSLRQRPCCALR